MSHADDIKKALKDNKVILGQREVIKKLRLGKLKKVFLSSNIKKDVKESVKKYASLGKVEVIQLRYANEDFGALCKRPYSISILGFIK